MPTVPTWKKLAARLDAVVVEPAPPEPPCLALERGDDCEVCRARAVTRGFTLHILPKASAAAPLLPLDHPDRLPSRPHSVGGGN